MTKRKSSTKGSVREAGQSGGSFTFSAERLNELVDVIVPRVGCDGPSGDVVALALVELVRTLTSSKTEYPDGEDGEFHAGFVARRAFERTGRFEDALEDWEDDRFEAALKKGQGGGAQ
jgi:hypothetical protein